MSKKIRLFLIGLVTAGAITVLGLQISVQGKAATFVNARDAGMSERTDNNKALQHIINKYDTDQTTIYVPKGSYYFSKGVIKLHSNLTFEFAKGASFRIHHGQFLSFSYPSPRKGYDGGVKNVTWKNASFIGSDVAGQSSFVQSMNHAQNITFEDCYFYNAENPEGHYFDIDGSHNIRIENTTFFGFNSSKARPYKEAIQVDYSNPVAMSYKIDGDKYDNLPSYDIHVINNRFMPIRNSDGIRYYAPNPIGEHTIYNSGKAGIIHDIYFSGNEVVDPQPLSNADYGTVNFDAVSNLWITNNRFYNYSSEGPVNYIRLNNPLKDYTMNNITISNNEFLNVEPTGQFILFDTRTKHHTSFKGVRVMENVVIPLKNKAPFIQGSFNIPDTSNIKDNTVLDALSR
ncbi:glycosyl hydrolase family 28-related protein [Lactiplantibacillus pentosus]|uniref:glycosyl hydrolase family 28-related protein n=1 Tax=Lactiplantibacillus pentosus TaxID=1589 RepID=UPI00132FFAA1|nr:glycosyl hydrolase family 28-related protein [Lactiplantibacillus pentosus]MBQ0837628.1 N-acetylmuramoyl-L-alanine amidase [Lactiplantibacillus pentosus]MBU7491643.1 N-acetylmuramoyl-L-alanine amidase [Lactiplantibacillus pentosus]MBU7494836.1 N-acetylmuramoyl-L-alanine amidase [Lactiplantibacillus pentosus]MBU7520824.1 N-acetylmuramoyl-L-alanine amidase [Lactiplantibacillus pentosus]MBU7527390.1 N-acetylmuramoyl-L-alanine amidase [Lactiplantibacillus pentosus]